jgi:hypothetical protein
MKTTKEQGSPKVALRHWDFEKDDDSADINEFDADARKLVNNIPGFVDGIEHCRCASQTSRDAVIAPCRIDVPPTKSLDGLAVACMFNEPTNSPGTASMR